MLSDEGIAYVHQMYTSLLHNIPGLTFIDTRRLNEPLFYSDEFPMHRLALITKPDEVISTLKRILQSEQVEGEYYVRFNDTHIELEHLGPWALVHLSGVDWIEPLWKFDTDLKLMSASLKTCLYVYEAIVQEADFGVRVEKRERIDN